MPSGKPKIAVVVSTVLSIHAFLKPHLRALAEDHDVTVCLPDDLPDLRARLDLPVRYRIIPIVRQPSPLADLRTLAVLIRHFRAERYDAVHTITPKAGLLGTLASYAARVPVRIHTFQGEIWATATGLRRRVFRGIDRLIARLTTHVTVVSQSEMAFLRAEHVLGPLQGQVLGGGSIGGVDLDRFHPDPQVRDRERKRLGYDPDDIVFLFLGRMNRDKGLDVLSRAFERVRAELPSAQLLLVGPDEGARPGPAARIQWEGFTERPEDLIRASDVLVFPSFREGFGVVVLEAAACGVPAIGSDIYGVRDAIAADETGILVPVQDDSALAGAMLTLGGDPVLRLTMGEAARSRVTTSFGQKQILAAFVAFYRNLELGRR